MNASILTVLIASVLAALVLAVELFRLSSETGILYHYGWFIDSNAKNRQPSEQRRISRFGPLSFGRFKSTGAGVAPWSSRWIGIGPLRLGLRRSELGTEVSYR